MFPHTVHTVKNEMKIVVTDIPGSEPSVTMVIADAKPSEDLSFTYTEVIGTTPLQQFVKNWKTHLESK